jgi:ABC-type sugar transport system ATPase subunit
MTVRQSGDPREPVLRAIGIDKHFGPVQALQDVSIEVFPARLSR